MKEINSMKRQTLTLILAALAFALPCLGQDSHTVVLHCEVVGDVLGLGAPYGRLYKSRALSQAELARIGNASQCKSLCEGYVKSTYHIVKGQLECEENNSFDARDTDVLTNWPNLPQAQTASKSTQGAPARYWRSEE